MNFDLTELELELESQPTKYTLVIIKPIIKI